MKTKEQLLKELEVYGKDLSWLEQLPEDFIHEHMDDLALDGVFMNQNLSEEFIRKYIDKFTRGGWVVICCQQKLPEDFIREFKDKVDWRAIKYNQFHLSDSFKEEFKNELDKW